MTHTAFIATGKSADFSFWVTVRMLLSLFFLDIRWSQQSKHDGRLYYNQSFRQARALHDSLVAIYVPPDVRILKLQELDMLPKAEQSVICCLIPVACYGLHPICSQHSLTSSLLGKLSEIPAMCSYVARPV